MKSFKIFIALLAVGSVQAQVAIEQNYITNPAVILEFNDQWDEVEALRNAKGIVLPIVSNLDAASVPGTVYIDAVDNQIKVVTAAGTSLLSTASAAYDFVAPDPTVADVGEGVRIGEEDSAPGVLVLNDPEKAMVLPVVESVINVRNPQPGMWVYEHRSKAMAFFNGSVWTLYQ